jgi:hypothetical protein
MRSVKVSIDVNFDPELELLPNMFADSAPQRRAKYSLFATVKHIGAPCELGVSNALHDVAHACAHRLAACARIAWQDVGCGASLCQQAWRH